ncbi:MAG: DNA repair protein RecO [Coriobacteriales bacterium]
MAKAYNARCIVLKHTKLGETDVIVTMIAEDGRQIRAVAKGLRKPGNRIGARLELFGEAEILLHEGRSLDIVREVRTIATNAAIRDELERTASASVEAELLEKLGRDGVILGERMYEMSATALRAMAEAPARKSVLIVAAFLLKAMAMQGFAPATRECALCGTPIERVHGFDVSYGGALCDACLSRLGICTTIDPAASAWIEALIFSTFAEIGEIESYPEIELLDLAHMWVREHAGFELKSIAFLKTLLMS